jgi:hypothetical protein
MSETYLGSWTLPSGNRVDVYLLPHRSGDPLKWTRVECRWDVTPSPEDVEHYRRVILPEIVRALIGENVLGVSE